MNGGQHHEDAQCDAPVCPREQGESTVVDKKGVDPQAEFRADIPVGEIKDVHKVMWFLRPLRGPSPMLFDDTLHAGILINLP